MAHVYEREDDLLEIKPYMKSIGPRKLSHEQIIELSRQYKAGDSSAKDKIVEDNQADIAKLRRMYFALKDQLRHAKDESRQPSH